MASKPQSIAKIVCNVNKGACRLEALDNVERDQRLVFDDEDDVTRKRHVAPQPKKPISALPH